MKEIKTLLLCKVKPIKRNGVFKSHKDIYKDIYKPTRGSGEYQRYMTLGGFDALAVYSTPACNNHEDDTAKRIVTAWDDKKRIISHINEERSYHPIHLIREEQNAQLNVQGKPPILLLSFVYGIKNKELFSCTELTINGQGRFQKKNRDVETNEAGTDGNSTIVEVYRCINISDRVLLTYTENIEKALKAIYYLEVEGAVRRTYTTVNFPLDENGEITENCYNVIDKQPQQCIMIQGSIRDSDEWEKIRKYLLGDKNAKGILSASDLYEAVNFGEADFLIAAKADGKVLGNLLREYLKDSSRYTRACWDIHTEIQTSKEKYDKNQEKSVDPNEKNSDAEDSFPDILLEQEKRFNKCFSKINHDWEWKYALKEVLSAQAGIDRHPMFKGPSYLLWDCFDIINDYLEGCAGGNNNGIPDIDSRMIPGLISESGNTIEVFIRCISRLTDQLTRNDDIIFRGLGRVPAMTATLPENLLEIYHAFLRKLADALIQEDKEKYHQNDNKDYYKYGFIIVPEINQRPQMVQLFNTASIYRQAIKQGEFYSWPSEQCHVIQLPLGDVYRPVHCLIPLVHECFHVFGDYYRSRAERTYYMLECLAAIYVDCVLYSAKDSSEFENNDMAKRVRQYLIEAAVEYLAGAVLDEAAGTTRTTTIFDALIQAFDQKNSDIQYKLFLDKLQSVLNNRFYHLLTEEGTNEVYNKARGNALEKEQSSFYFGFIYNPASVNNRQGDNRRYYWDTKYAGHGKDERLGYNMVVDVQWLFKECYADFMTMEVLGLCPDEYLEAFNNDLGQLFNSDEDRSLSKLKSEKEKGDIIIFCQRIAVVLAAHYECNKGTITREVIVDSIRKSFLPTKRSTYSGKKAEDDQSAHVILQKCFESLTYGNDMKSGEQLSTADRVFPVSALFRIMYYLKEAHGKLNSEIIEEAKIKEHFDRIFRQEELFGNRDEIKTNDGETDGSETESYSADDLVEKNRRRIIERK